MPIAVAPALAVSATLWLGQRRSLVTDWYGARFAVRNSNGPIRDSAEASEIPNPLPPTRIPEASARAPFRTRATATALDPAYDEPSRAIDVKTNQLRL
jgi:hypothetical protein